MESVMGSHLVLNLISMLMIMNRLIKPVLSCMHLRHLNFGVSLLTRVREPSQSALLNFGEAISLGSLR